jgi:hypothetical protein
MVKIEERFDKVQIKFDRRKFHGEEKGKVKKIYNLFL